VGSYPRGIAFDGTNIWVANQNSNNVSKLLASSGMVVGTYLWRPAYRYRLDGTNIGLRTTLATASLSCWPALGRCSAPTLSEQILGVWPSTEPTSGCKQRSNNLTELLASTGAVVGTYSVGTVHRRSLRWNNVWWQTTWQQRH